MPYIKRNRNSNKHTILPLYCIAGAASGMCPTLTPAQAYPILLSTDGSQGDAGILLTCPFQLMGLLFWAPPGGLCKRAFGVVAIALFSETSASGTWTLSHQILGPATVKCWHVWVVSPVGLWSTVGLWRKQSQQTFVQLLLQNQYQFQKLGLLVVTLADCASDPEFGNKPHVYV